MKTNNIFLALGASALMLLSSGCSKDFLEKEPSELITPQQMGRNSSWNPNILLGQIQGGTSITYLDGQTMGNHVDFAQKANDIQLDLLSGDMEMPNVSHGYFESTTELKSGLATNVQFSYSNWRLYYKVIFTCNGIFDSMGGDTNVPADANSKLSWGQAKVLRAYAYFYLTNFYAKPYAEAPDAKRLPLYRKISDSPIEPSSTKEVYDLIVEDLTQGIAAIQASGITRTEKSAVDANVGYSYLAYTYLQMGEYAKAYEAAKKVIDSGAFSLLPLAEITTNGFNDLNNNSEFIWGIPITGTNTGYLASFWSHVDVYTYGYASAAGNHKVINLNLYNEIPDTDARKAWFSARTGVPNGKFFTAVRNAEGKLQVGLDRSWESDIHFMRLADMYLVAAEAAARTGNDADAKALLIKLLEQRTVAANWPAVKAEVEGLSNADLLERIYYNWRVEMWGEGRGLLTMKRFKKAVARSSRSYHLQNETVNYNDERLVYDYPEREKANNPFLKP